MLGCSIVILLPSIVGTSTTATGQRMGNVHTTVGYVGQLAPAYSSKDEASAGVAQTTNVMGKAVSVVAL